MDNPDGTYVDDSQLTVFYQLLGVAPQLAATLYEPDMDEGVRAWLNDVYDAAPDPKTRRWLRVLYLYYGLTTGDSTSYQSIAAELGVSYWVSRRLAARGLRYLWFVTRSQKSLRENLKPLMELALVANEWVTCDPSDTISFAVWVEDLTPDGIPTSELTARTSLALSGDGHKIQEPINLWDPVYAGPDETRVIMKGGKPVV